MSKVWIVIRKQDYGYSEPLAVFDNYREAEIMLKGADATYGTLHVRELVVNSLEHIS